MLSCIGILLLRGLCEVFLSGHRNCIEEIEEEGVEGERCPEATELEKCHLLVNIRENKSSVSSEKKESKLLTRKPIKSEAFVFVFSLSFFLLFNVNGFKAKSVWQDNSRKKGLLD